MLISLIIQLILINYLLNQKENKRKIGIIIFTSLFLVVLQFLLWRLFQVVHINRYTIIWLSISKFNLNSILSIFAILLTCNVTQMYLSITNSRFISKRREWSIKKILLLILLTIPSFIGLLVYFSGKWAVATFDNLEFSQIIYMLSEPMSGVDIQQIINYVYNPLLNTVFLSMLLFVVYYFFIIYDFKLNRRKKPMGRYMWLIISSLFLLVYGFAFSINQIGYADIKAYFIERTALYEKYYVNPKEVNVTFPEKKQNLIYIFLESMESSYADVENGGIKNENLIPNLTELALSEGIHFSHSDNLGGMTTLTGANATATSMVSQTSGTPLIASRGALNTNDYGDQGQVFLPGVYSIGEILADNDYRQVLFLGSDAKFAGRDKYFTQHGEYEIRDYNWAIEQNLIPSDYSVWWGYEDDKLFEFAKETLLELSNEEQPFNFTMLTADTHFEDGYMSEQTPDLFGDQYSNVIHYSDSQVYDFIQWMKEQDFYEDTTIIIVGDHLTMDKDFFDDAPGSYKRTVYNVILNSKLTPFENTNRLFTALDMYPTTLAAMGATIEGDRLGLGTNLFSTQQTMAEKLGMTEFSNELKKRSEYYSRVLMQGTDDEITETQSSNEVDPVEESNSSSNKSDN